MFPATYLKPVVVNGKPTDSDLSSIVTHTNHIGMRQHLASNNKILLNDDADLIAEAYGLYNVNDCSKEHERNLILCGYDGFTNTSRTTGTTIIQIEDKRLTIMIGTTGGKLMKNMKNWMNCTGYDGSHNRFLYMSMPKLVHSRPQDFQVNPYSTKNPSFTHLCVITHLFGTVRYIFAMTDAERTKFCGAKFDQPPPLSQTDGEQTQVPRSAMFTVWNLIADLVETHDLKQNQQQQVTDLYAKAGTTFPRLACLMQLYFNAMRILELASDVVVFAEGDSYEMVVNENFVNKVDMIIKRDYHIYDKSYLPLTEIDQEVLQPMVLVEKDTVVAAWKWYQQHLNIATNLFTIDLSFSGRSLGPSPSIARPSKTIKQMIMYLDFNIFPVSTISVKHPITGQTGLIKNRPALGEQALQELIADGLLLFNYFLVDARARNMKAYMKMPMPPATDPARELFVEKLSKHGIDVKEYCSVYEKSSIPPNNNLSNLALQIFEGNACFVFEYAKYRIQLSDIIQKHLQNGWIEETGEGNFTIMNSDRFPHQFWDIVHIGSTFRSEQPRGAGQTISSNGRILTQQPTTSIARPSLTTTEVVVNRDAAEQDAEALRNVRYDLLTNDQANSSTVLSGEHNSTSAIETYSAVSLEKDDKFEKESSGTPMQQSVREVTNTFEKGSEQMVRKAMRTIMTGRSAIYTKTDLTQICNKSNIRLEAVKRLVGANLLRHGENYWIEPNRTKKESKKEVKRLVREGWLKNFPDSATAASKFRFIQLLQDNVNLSYDEYLKSFYPCQEENVFTHNSWTLSDELVELIQSNHFYEQHIRWNVQRFRPGDVSDTRAESTATQASHVTDDEQAANEIPSDDVQESSSKAREEETTAHACSPRRRGKRKEAESDHLHEHHTRSQHRRAKIV